MLGWVGVGWGGVGQVGGWVGRYVGWVGAAGCAPVPPLPPLFTHTPSPPSSPPPLPPPPSRRTPVALKVGQVLEQLLTIVQQHLGARGCAWLGGHGLLGGWVGVGGECVVGWLGGEGAGEGGAAMHRQHTHRDAHNPSALHNPAALHAQTL